MSIQSRSSWKSFFHRSATAVFVLGPNGRLRYANPAWESLTGKTMAALRGTRVSAKRESASPLWKVLAPPPEAWAGSPIHVRRARPEVEYGPPWWDVQFVPLKQSNGYAVVGFVTQVGETPEKHAFREPEALARARADHAKWYTLELFVGESLEMQCLRRQLQMAAESKAPVWISGYRGVGKETAARVIHHLGPMRERAIVVVDCLRLQPYLIEHIIFGRGGFAGSHTVGTLVLKHPEELPQDQQAKILAWSESDSAPRFIVVSGYSPDDVFRSSPVIVGFCTKLAVIRIPIGGLHWRRDSLVRIVEHFNIGECDESLWPALNAASWWKMNDFLRLRKAMAEAARNAAGTPIRDEHLPENVRHFKLASDSPALHLTPLDKVMEKTERETIEIALEYSGNNPKVAAQRLDMPVVKLLKRMKALGIEA
jgi:transcriptional regulator with PAS, ATPase and Fis domain